MMHIAHLSPRQVDEMMMWEVSAAIAYHNDFHSDQKGPREMSDADIERIERELAEEERNT
jgi:microsomal dipeptidase-like Zn-dependent dipeptidase